MKVTGRRWPTATGERSHTPIMLLSLSARSEAPADAASAPADRIPALSVFVERTGFVTRIDQWVMTDGSSFGERRS